VEIYSLQDYFWVSCEIYKNFVSDLSSQFVLRPQNYISQVATRCLRSTDLNNLESKLLKLHWAPFLSLLSTVLFDSFIDFSRKAHKTWLSLHTKQSKTLANFHHTRGDYTCPTRDEATGDVDRNKHFDDLESYLFVKQKQNKWNLAARTPFCSSLNQSCRHGETLAG